MTTDPTMPNQKCVYKNLLRIKSDEKCMGKHTVQISLEFPKGLDSSKKDITRINATKFLKDMFRHAYAIISLLE